MQQFRTLGALTIASATLLGAGACSQTPRTPSPVLDPQPASSYPKVAVAEPQLAKYLGITPGSVVVTGGDGEKPLAVVVPIRSLANSAVRIQYRFMYYDASGRQLREGVWRDERIEPQFEVRLQSNATDLQSRDWRVEIRSAR